MARQFVIGGADWLDALRDGAFTSRPPISASPGSRVKRAPIDGFIRYSDLPLAKWHGEDCPYCHNEMLIGTRHYPSRDHVHPRHLGGTLHESNRLIACGPCNNSKGGLTLAEWADLKAKKGDLRGARILRALIEARAAAERSKEER